MSRMSRMSWTRLILGVLFAGLLSVAVAPAAHAAPAHAASAAPQPLCSAQLYPHVPSSVATVYPWEQTSFEITVNFSCGNPFYTGLDVSEYENMPPNGGAYWGYSYFCYCSQSGSNFWINLIGPPNTYTTFPVYLTIDLTDYNGNLLARRYTTTTIYCIAGAGC